MLTKQTETRLLKAMGLLATSRRSSDLTRDELVGIDTAHSLLCAVLGTVTGYDSVKEALERGIEGIAPVPIE